MKGLKKELLNSDDSQFLKPILCLLPHCDDEIFISRFLENWSRDNQSLICAYLTEDAKYPGLGEIRHRESIQYLNSLGVKEIFFLGQEYKVDINHVMIKMNALAIRLEELIHKYNIGTIVTPAYEGGHPDHDASSVIADVLKAKLARENINLKHYCFLTYNGYQTTWKFFWGLHELPNMKMVHAVNIGRFGGFHLIFTAIRYFPTQVITWLSLGLPIILRILFNPIIKLYFSENLDSTKPPHEGKVLYERHNRTTWNEFIKHSSNFTKNFLGRPT